MTQKTNNKRILKGIAWVSAIFGLVVCLLVIANYLQMNRIDPVNTEVINQLVERLAQNPGDQELRQQIREMDLLARKAYFTNQWQIKTGGYLILLALGVFIIAWQLLDLNTRKQVMANPDAPKDILGIQKNARIGIGIVGGLLVLVAMVVTFLSYNQLSDKIDSTNVAIVAQNQQNENAEAITLSPQPETQVKDTVNTAVIEAEVEQPANKKEPEAKIPVEPKIIEQTPQETTTTKKVQQNYPSADQLKKNFATFRGYHGNGVVYQDNVPQNWDGTAGQNILWKVPVPVHGYNSPIVWGDKVFLTGANEEVREVFCFNASTGNLMWRTKAQGIEGSPEKAPKTTSDTGLGAPTMTTDGKRVYAIFGTGDLIALDMEGNQVWAKNLGVPQNHYGHASSLLMYRDKLIIQYDMKGSAHLIGLDAATGEELYKTPRDVKVSWASPVLIEHNNQPQVILVADPTVAAYNPENGEELWSVDCIFGEVGPSACYADGIVYATNEYALLAAIDVSNPTEVLWEYMDLLSDIPSPVAANGLLIAPTSYGVFACLDAKTGESLWEHEAGNNIYSSPMIVGENVYLMDTKGVMHIFKLSRDGYQSVAENPLGEDVLTTPAFAGGRIYIRTNNNLYCIGK